VRLIDIIREREQARVGIEMGPTRWRDVTQDDMNGFGRSTHDPDPMHVDPEWAARHSPFGGTIAFGFWTLSMITAFQHEMAGGADGGDYEGVDHVSMIGINYGCDRLRFIEPVQIGSRIRTTDIVVEIEGRDRPALSTRWLSMILVPEADVKLRGFRREGAA